MYIANFETEIMKKVVSKYLRTAIRNRFTPINRNSSLISSLLSYKRWRTRPADHVEAKYESRDIREYAT